MRQASTMKNAEALFGNPANGFREACSHVWFVLVNGMECLATLSTLRVLTCIPCQIFLNDIFLKMAKKASEANLLLKMTEKANNATTNKISDADKQIEYILDNESLQSLFALYCIFPVLVHGVFNMAMVRATAEVYCGCSTKWTSCLNSAIRSLYPMLANRVLCLLLAISMFFFQILAGVIVGLFGEETDQISHLEVSVNTVGFTVVLVGTILVFVCSTFIATYAEIAIAVERLGSIGSTKRGWKLCKSRVWFLLKMTTPVSIISCCLSSFSGLPTTWTSHILSEFVSSVTFGTFASM